MTENDGAFARGATFISAALGLVGQTELAAKTRPSKRKPGTRLVDEEDGEGTEGGVGAGEGGGGGAGEGAGGAGGTK